MSIFLSPRFADLAPYIPGEQPQSTGYIKLNTNESPFAPSPAVIAALTQAEARALNLYPDPDARVATAAIAARFGVGTDQVLLGNGSDEILAFCFQAFCDAHTPACYPDITYGFYQVFARMYAVPSRVIPLSDPLLLVNKEDFYRLNGTIFLANPNAPTGRALALGEVEDILRHNREHVVVVDEAYVDFGAQSAAALLPRYENLVVVHTFSKSRSLAGARLGYALAHPALIADLARMKFSFNPYSVNRLSLLAAAAAIADEAYFTQCTRAIQETRAYTTDALLARGFAVLPSCANFVFAAPPAPLTGAAYYAALKERAVLVRHFDKPRISNHVRITIGTPEQMDALLIATDEIIRKP